MDPTPATRLDRAWEVLGEATAYISMMGGAIDPAEWNGIERQYRPLIEAAVLEAAMERVEGLPSHECETCEEYQHQTCAAVLAALREEGT